MPIFPEFGDLNLKKKMADLEELQKIRDDPWERRKSILLLDIEKRTDSAIAFIKGNYGKDSEFEMCREFIFQSLYDVPRSDMESLSRLGFFPWTEIQHEFSEALNHALFGSYKACFDSYRRILELAVISAYFLQSHIPGDEAILWLRSDRETPQMRKAMRELLKVPRFQNVNAQLSWKTKFDDFYWEICDIIHVRGEKSSIRTIQPSHIHYLDISVPEFSGKSLSLALDTFIETTRHVATVFAIENPILLIGLDMFQKFGLNFPLCGFFSKTQSELMRKLILSDISEDLIQILTDDQEVTTYIDWYNTLPDLTEDELEQQAREHDEWLKSMENEK